MLFIELLILALIIFVQYHFFIGSKREIQDLKTLFPAAALDGDNINTWGNEIAAYEQIDVPGHNVKQFQEIIAATNYYLKKNIGSTDFNIIKNIADRATSAQENKISSEVSLPLYLGLMGTFLGVILGLGSVVFGLSNGDGDLSSSTISSFIAGVLLAMIVSLIGLIFTTCNNSIYLKQAIAVRDKNRNNYFNFLQSELLPQLDNSLYSVLDQFKSNISDFNTKFTQNLDLFDASFGDNIKHLKETVLGMSGQIETVNKNTQVQLDFLNQLRSIGYNRMAEANIKVFDKLKEAGPLLISFIKEHQNFNANLEHVNGFADKIGNLLNRVTTFEDGINSLGREIHNSEMLGSEVINVVKKHLTSIEQKEHLIAGYASASTKDVESFLESALERIKVLSHKIENNLDQAFDFNVEGNLMQNLNYLKPLNEHTLEMKNAVKSMEQSDGKTTELETIIQHLSDLKTIYKEQQRPVTWRQKTFKGKGVWSWFPISAKN
ncbi:hypothetical protein [Pedobacter gandavensis]|uniref:MotA/TolQ/ExbB proton channel domain-containing protein n=1 Tax=Pedobacter gandavensis TaxID=2679963 RepID=A0ABR6ERC8_9SPHI|nr:hypothetical protein [Pedobacter gandavensis]MBB2147597.1 hypothetical protein [Pedobacter gandavensis]